ncbi:MAG: triose-phosphate isomerase [Nitrospirae bacterium]|nr:MAG: triose-phosphate isomerase [Nitrospirota bacterium]
MLPRLIVGNWKMHKTVQEACELVQAVLAVLKLPQHVEAAVAPPFTALHAVGEVIAGSPLRLAAQNVCWETEGAFTGEISPHMLHALGCQYVIIGHSERRRLFGETDAMINKKVKAALQSALSPILCVGETFEEREAGDTEQIVQRQTVQGLEGISPEDLQRVTIAYEPVWAIGTGLAATTTQAEAVHQMIHETLRHRWGESGAHVRILYGGSVTPANAPELFQSAHINGALVGKACLDPDAFAMIIRTA